MMGLKLIVAKASHMCLLCIPPKQFLRITINVQCNLHNKYESRVQVTFDISDSFISDFMSNVDPQVYYEYAVNLLYKAHLSRQ